MNHIAFEYAFRKALACKSVVTHSNKLIARAKFCYTANNLLRFEKKVRKEFCISNLKQNVELNFLFLELLQHKILGT